MALPQIVRFVQQIWRRPTSERLFSPRLKRLYRSLSFFPFLILFSILLWGNFAASPLICAIRVWTTELVAPVLYGMSWINETLFITLPNFFISWGQAYERMDEEKNTTRYVETLQQRLLFLESENTHLRQLLKAPGAEEKLVATLPIKAFMSDAFSHGMLLGGGTQMGIAKNMPIIAERGLVGKVVEVGPSTTRALLILDPSFRVPVVVGKDLHHAIAAGNNSEEMLLLYLNVFQVVNVGDVVFTSGHGGIFPAGIPVGVVSHVDPVVKVRPFTIPHALKFVKIIPQADLPSLQGKP